MPDEFDSYRDTVLDVARKAGNVPPSDLFVRYDLDPRRVGDPAEFTRRVEMITKYWRSLKLQRKYLPIATALLAAHTELEQGESLTLEAFTKQREEGRGKAQSQLDQRIAVIAASSPCVTLSGLRRLVAALDGAFGEQEVRDALKTHDVDVIDPPWDLPTGQVIPAARSLRAPLTALGFRLSPEVLFGAAAVRAGFKLRNGFRLAADGRTLTLTALEKARDEQSRSKQDERKTAMDNVLAILISAAADADRLHELLLWEVREHLRPDVEAGLPVRLVAHSAGELGLDTAEAMQLAVTLAGDGDGKKDSGAVQLAVEALRGGELQEARLLLDGLPADEALDARTQLDEALRRVADLVTKAETAWSRGDNEEAAGLLSAAGEIARDDESLHARLADIPPPPPGEVTAGIDGDRVVVRWTPSQARTAGVRYRLVRASGTPAVSSGAGTTVADTQANEAFDAMPPSAVPIHYTVFASRGDAWSTGTTAAAVESLPEVADVELRADERSVSASWRAHPSAAEIVVTRTSRDAPNATPQQIPISAGGGSTFTDTTVRSGQTYDYTFRAAYLTAAGVRRMSEPAVATATPTSHPDAVTDLAHEVLQEQGGPVMRLTWRPPEVGVVEIRTSAEAPIWPAGTQVTRVLATTFGQAVGATVTTGANGLAHLTFPVRHGRVVVTAITLSGDQAAIGETITLSLVDAVSGVRAERLDDRVRVRWVWPRGASTVRVRWWPSDGADPPIHVEELEISERVHTDSGGADLATGPGPVVVSLQTVARGRGEESLSAAVVARVAARPTTVRYEVRLAGVPGLRRIELVLTSDRSCRVPALVVVHRADGIVPLRADSGRVVASLPSRHLSSGTPESTRLPVRVSPLEGLACFVDPNSPQTDEVTLVPTTY